MGTSPLDLTSLDLVKNWIPGANNSDTDDVILQSCITSWGFAFLSRTGLGDQSGDYQQSPFVQVCNFNETYDGSGTLRLMLINRPVQNVSALIINGIQVAQSISYASQGWVVDGSRRSIALRPGLLGWGAPTLGLTSWIAGSYRAFGGGLRFYDGIQNINVQYSAGYSNTPQDIVETANRVVAQNYRRRNWVDEASRAMAGGAGTIRYRDWAIDPLSQDVVNRYTRTL